MNVPRPNEDERATECWPARRGFEASSQSGTVANLHALPAPQRPQRHAPTSFCTASFRGSS
jgi:hypothetical protein